MYPTSFDPPNRAPLDFNTDRTARGVADAPEAATDRFAAHVSCPDAESLLAELGLPDRVAREILVERSAQHV